MNSANEITEELQNMGSSLAGLSRVMPYEVPVNFFRNFEAGLSRSDLDIVPEWSKAMPFAIPDNYFEGLADNLVAASVSGALESATSIPPPFQVPNGYFESLPDAILSTVKPKKITFFPAYIKWAAAAVLVLGMGAYAVFFNNKPALGTDNMLASVPSREIQDYLQHTYRLDAERIMNNTDINNMNIDSKDIIAYLNETGWD
jgi:hypothetical protein